MAGFLGAALVWWLKVRRKGRGERKGRGGALSSCGTRMSVFFQEHEYAPIDTNAYVMGVGNHEKHERGWEYLLLNLMIKLVIFSCVSCVSWLNKKV